LKTPRITAIEDKIPYCNLVYLPSQQSQLGLGYPNLSGKAYRKGPGIFVAHWEVRDADELNEVDRSTLILEAV
jgi:hypothetical protein